ncbi:MAG: right-handed parallel beta-helix repeat-containing protein, partial [Candidatus Geothermincolia bacterium]
MLSPSKLRIVCLAAIVLMLSAVLSLTAGNMPARAQATLLVTSNADAGPGTLRDAIDQANTDVGPDTINFSAGMTIQPLSPYQLTENYPCTIDAQANNVILDCSSMPANVATECLLVTTDDNLIDGLKIVNMPVTGDPAYGVGIRFRSTSGNQVTGCYLGTADGTTAASNDTGIALEDCLFPWTMIGVPGGENVISGNRTSGMRVVGGSQMTIRNNYIGTNADGSAALGNGTYGIDLEDSSIATVTYNTISASPTSIYQSGGGNQSVISGNHIGTNSTGTAVLSDPNTDTGIFLTNNSYSSIGGNTPEARNIISGLNVGIDVDTSASSTAITGNYIGTDETGSTALGIGQVGVIVRNTGTAVGNMYYTDGNVISAAGTANVWVLDPATEVRVQSNIIGLNAAGTAVLGNTPTGVLVTGANCFVGWPYGLMMPRGGKYGAIGSGETGGNIISGCGTGLYLAGPASGTTVQSNYFGTDFGGAVAMPNGDNIRVTTSNNSIGGTREYEGNLISGAANRGIFFESGSGNLVYQNYIGTNAAGTGAIPNGIGIEAAASGNATIVGGEEENQQNTIAHNTGAGVRVPDAGMNVTIAANSIYANGGLGIDLDPPGPNVPQSNFPYPTTGKPNRNMHFPVIDKAEHAGNTLSFAGTATPSSTVRVFFADGGSTAYGEGRAYIGKTTASASGNFGFSAGVTSLTTRFVTATATDSLGNTSEFSLNAPVTEPDNLSTVYYLAEGYTADDTFYPGEYFDTYILLQNPSSTTASITATFMRNSGMPNIVQKYTVSPHSRFTINVDQVPGLEACDVSSKIECTNGVGIAVERSMYFNYYGKTGGSSSIAVTAPSRTWYFAEGHTANDFDTWLLLQNPGEKEAKCAVAFMDENGNVSRPVYTVAPHTRYTVEVDKIPGFAANHVSMSVSSDQPVVAERSMYFKYGGWAEGGHNSVGA